MKRRNKLLSILAICVAAVLIAVGLTTSYLVDREEKDNIITIGKVSLRLDESPFDSTSSYVAAAGSMIPKAPKLINNGNTDEYAFVRVAVPKKEVTMLYEQDTDVEGTLHKKGSKIGEKASAEIFKLLADAPDVALVTENDYSQIFQYHKGDNATDKEGWIYFKTVSDENNDYYYFGYNRKLLKPEGSTQDQTITLFDKLQLKSFIDEELTNTADKNNVPVTVSVTAYGIQADNLELDLPEGKELLSEAQLRTVFDIVIRKGGLES